MTAKRELIMYGRTLGCPFITTAKRVLEREQVPYRELLIDKDKEAAARVVAWTGFLSVPTLLIAEAGELLPYTLPDPLEQGASPRGINRGSMITEASDEELMAWLRQHALVTASTAAQREG
jgi:glutaredoxin